MSFLDNAAQGLGTSIVGSGAAGAAGAVGGVAGKYLGGTAGKLIGGAAGAVAGKLGGALLGALFGRTDPDIPFSFYVEIDGIMGIKFREAHGLEWKSESVSFYEGGNYRYKVNLPGPGSFTPLVLKKGYYAANGSFYDWMDKLLMHGPEGTHDFHRASLSLVSCDAHGSEAGRFNFYGAFISKYKGPDFNAMENSIAFEEIEITYDYFEFVAGGALAGALGAGMKALGKLL